MAVSMNWDDRLDQMVMMKEKENAMGMTRADYQDIANVLNRCRRHARYGAQKELWSNTVAEFLHHFQNTRPNFDSNRFVEACGNIDMEPPDQERMRQSGQMASEGWYGGVDPNSFGAMIAPAPVPQAPTHTRPRNPANRIPPPNTGRFQPGQPLRIRTPQQAVTIDPLAMERERNRIMRDLATMRDTGIAPPARMTLSDVAESMRPHGMVRVTRQELERDYGGGRAALDQINQVFMEETAPVIAEAAERQLAAYNAADVAFTSTRIMDEGIPEEELPELDDAAED